MGLLAGLKKLFGIGSSKNSLNNGDRMLTCEDCGSSFVFDKGEQVFFKSKGFTDPKRCPRCRKSMKHRHKKKQRGGGGRRRRSSRNRSIIDGDSPYVDQR